jgi:hypothetical protein
MSEDGKEAIRTEDEVVSKAEVQARTVRRVWCVVAPRSPGKGGRNYSRPALKRTFESSQNRTFELAATPALRSLGRYGSVLRQRYAKSSADW